MSKYLFFFALFFTSCGLLAPSPSKTTTKNLAFAPYDAIIVPGVPFDGETWSETMKQRVHWSKYLYDNGYAKNVIYSGSAVYSPYEEAKIMAIYAEALGIPKENIFTDPRAEHSTENVYYSYKVAKKNGFQKLALATDPFQTNSLRKFIKKFEFPVELLPIIYDTLNVQIMNTPMIDGSPARRDNFVSIAERESFFKRLKGTFGQNIRWQAEDLKTRRLKKKYGDRIEAPN
jgi:uncharacterized SAM-binding protein YcdF (DUF218 family)